MSLGVLVTVESFTKINGNDKFPRVAGIEGHLNVIHGLPPHSIANTLQPISSALVIER